MEIIVKKIGEAVGEKAKETLRENKRLISMILFITAGVLAVCAIVLIIVNILNRRRKATIEILETEDTDGDGQIDAYVVDTNGDGEADSIYLDTDGNGAVDTIIEDTDGDGEPETVYEA